MITRRRLLAGLAAVAGAALTHKPMLAAAAPDPLDQLRQEYEWAARGLLDAIETRDLTPWKAGTSEEKPNRWRLARAVVMSRELETQNPYGDILREQFQYIWEQLSRR
ncbi:MULTISPECIES: hypothetical protein [unclassified Methylobacterium]|uniref:hypothetical protein n=1 Tax=unclassified Methylobacterium TaxID=2615210 RepID=UPI0022698DAB|nr:MULTISPECIES: hypothetical protein [unclassified Methylobacterium]